MAEELGAQDVGLDSPAHPVSVPRFPWGQKASPRRAWSCFSPLPSCHGKAEECIGLCRALMSALNWLLRCAAFYTEKVKETLEQAAAENQLKMCLERLEKMLGSTKNRALIHIAKLEETCMLLPLPCPVACSACGRCQGFLLVAAGPGEMSLPPLPSPSLAPAALSLQLQAHPSSSPVAVTVSSLAPCHPLPPPLHAALGRRAELM